MGLCCLVVKLWQQGVGLVFTAIQEVLSKIRLVVERLAEQVV